jgi:signal transduction histidine kinase
VIALARDITRRLAAEAELRASEEALHAAQQKAAVIEDRERIARDLHDTVIQRLFAEGLHLQAVAARADEETSKRLQSSIEGLDETIRQLRSSIFTLQTNPAGPGGLWGELLDVITECREGLGTDPRLQLDGPIETIDEPIRPHLAPVLREALTNAARHSAASDVRISITASDTITVRVDDDGVGVPDEVFGGNGLRNLASRAEELGGSLSVTARPQGGTTFLWQVPATASSPSS